MSCWDNMVGGRNVHRTGLRAVMVFASNKILPVVGEITFCFSLYYMLAAVGPQHYIDSGF